MSIEKVLNENNGDLIETPHGYVASICDAELDILQCKFSGDDAVEIDTNGLTYVMLTTENLFTLIDLIQEVENKL